MHVFINSVADNEHFTFGPDGQLYVPSSTANDVKKFSGTIGTQLGAFVTAGSGGLDFSREVDFGPDGNAYVTSFDNDRILRYNGATGAFIDTFVPAGSGGLNSPTFMIFTSLVPEPAGATTASVAAALLLNCRRRARGRPSERSL